MKILATTTMGAMLAVIAANAQTAGTPRTGTDTRGVNRTGQSERGAADMQTGSATVPGTAEDTTDPQAPATTPDAERTPAQDPFAGIEPAEPGGSTSMTGQTGTTQSTQPSQQQAQPAPQGAQPGWVDQVQPAEPGQTTTTEPGAEVQPADIGSASRAMPAAAGNWLAMLLGGGLLSAAGLALRRR